MMLLSFCRTHSLGSAFVQPLLALSFLALSTATSVAAPTPPPQSDAERKGPFVLTDKILSDLLEEGYEIRATLGTSLVLQKDASVFSCSIVPDQKTMSYHPYFACSALQEIRPKGE